MIEEDYRNESTTRTRFDVFEQFEKLLCSSNDSTDDSLAIRHAPLREEMSLKTSRMFGEDTYVSELKRRKTILWSLRSPGCEEDEGGASLGIELGRAWQVSTTLSSG